MRKKQARYYASYTDDFTESKKQDFLLPKNYRWVREDVVSKVLSAVVYTLAAIFSGVYCKFFLHMQVRGRERLKTVDGGYYIYGNHTQPIGDVFIPALCALPKRIYTVVSTANYGIPFIGRLLPYLGALPIVDSVHGIRELERAMEKRLLTGHPIVIYPEAHVWEYYTDIRPFPDTSFRFPAKTDAPAFAMTVTYQKARCFKRPIMRVYIDGPFYGCGNTVKEKAKSLHAQIYTAMQERSKNSNYKYIEYFPL